MKDGTGEMFQLLFHGSTKEVGFGIVGENLAAATAQSADVRFIEDYLVIAGDIVYLKVRDEVVPPHAAVEFEGAALNESAEEINTSFVR